MSERERQRLKLRWEVKQRGPDGNPVVADVSFHRSKISLARLYIEDTWVVVFLFFGGTGSAAITFPAPTYQSACVAAEQRLREILTDALAALGDSETP